MKNVILLILIMVGTEWATAQVGIGTTEPKAILDIVSDNSGILIPRVNNPTTAIPTENLSIGMLVFDSSTNDFVYYDGEKWSPFITMNNSITQNFSTGAGNTVSTKIKVNQSNYAPISGDTDLGNMYENNRVTINPTFLVGEFPKGQDSPEHLIRKNNIDKTTQGYRGVIFDGGEPQKFNDYRIYATIKLERQPTGQTGNVNYEIISNATGTVVHRDSFLVPETLNVGEEMPIVMRFTAISSEQSVGFGKGKGYRIVFKPRGQHLAGNVLIKLDEISRISSCDSKLES